MTFYTLDPPVLRRAGYTGSGADAKPFYFGCGLCGKQGEIAGFIGSGPTIFDVATLENPSGSPFRRLALFCKPCLQTQMEAATNPNHVC